MCDFAIIFIFVLVTFLVWAAFFPFPWSFQCLQGVHHVEASEGVSSTSLTPFLANHTSNCLSFVHEFQRWN